jgi:hypothetical protein
LFVHSFSRCFFHLVRLAQHKYLLAAHRAVKDSCIENLNASIVHDQTNNEYEQVDHSLSKTIGTSVPTHNDDDDDQHVDEHGNEPSAIENDNLERQDD